MKLTPVQQQIMEGKICPYCGDKTQFVDSSVVYSKSYGMIYYCARDKAWVGVHKGTNVALGRLADAALRQRKKQAHEIFDQIWQKGVMSRQKAYKWLSHKLLLEPEHTHIGMFSEKTCRKVIYHATMLLGNNDKLI
jgi:hypothetical protein